MDEPIIGERLMNGTTTKAAKAAVLLGAILVAACAAAALWWAIGRLGLPRPSAPSSSASGADRAASPGDPAAPAVDPALRRFVETDSFPVGLDAPRGLAVDGQGRILVAGDRKLRAFRLGDQRAEVSDFPLDFEPRCLAVGRAGDGSEPRIYVAAKDRVDVLDAQGRRLATWRSFGAKAAITSIAVDASGEHDVYVADAGNRVVWRFAPDGALLGEIGRPDPKRKILGFIITSESFDIVCAPDGLIHAVNPRALRVEAFTPRGDLEGQWGRGSPEIDGFFGCCNPAHLAVLSDGRFVTAEKGIPRVKLFSPRGELLAVVADESDLDATPADLAVDAEDRVLVLDPATRQVRRFVARAAEPPLKTAPKADTVGSLP